VTFEHLFLSCDPCSVHIFELEIGSEDGSKRLSFCHCLLASTYELTHKILANFHCSLVTARVFDTDQGFQTFLGAEKVRYHSCGLVRGSHL
jgi:hypothetical protein